MFYNIVIKRLFKCRQRNAIESINEATKIEEEEKDHDSSIAASGVRMNFYKINTRSIRPELSIPNNKESDQTKDSSMTHSEHKLKKMLMLSEIEQQQRLYKNISQLPAP